MKHSTVLLVNDEPRVETEMMASAERTGYPCVAVHSKNEALKRLDELDEEVGLVLENLDSRVSGLALLREMKSQHRKVPIVVLVAPGEPNISKLALVFGAESSLRKPIDESSLDELVRHYCDGVN
jgi:DNA-binding NtrC family response regulator